MKPPVWKLIFLAPGVVKADQTYTIQDLSFLPPSPRTLRDILSRDCSPTMMKNPEGRWVLSFSGKNLIADAERLQEVILIKGWAESSWFKTALQGNQEIIKRITT